MANFHPFDRSTGLQRPLFNLFGLLLICGLLFSMAQPAAAAGNPPGPIMPPLNSIYKIASKQMLTTGETMTYTIHLSSMWATPAILLADVTDPLPVGLEYVPGSAKPAGTYDPATRTISWSKVEVGGTAPADLKFDVKDTLTVAQPTPTVNTATISMNGLSIQRQAWVLLMPVTPPPSPLAASFKSASPFMLAPGDVVTYTIHLVNSGSATQTVTVADLVPAPLTYVADSVSTGGVYDAITKTVTWSGVDVPAGTQVLLTFNAKAPAVLPDTLRPAPVKNTADIKVGDLTLLRSADVLLVPMQRSPLEGSFKQASQKAVAPGQKFTYTINLQNSSSAAVTASVKDVLPVQVTYVADSANAGGVYDPATRTLTWTDISVLGGTPTPLTFDVTANALPTAAVFLPILNTAAITSEGLTILRSAKVMLLPAPGGDNIPPVVTSLTIGDRDVLNSPDVTLHIAATDNVKVTMMNLKEWALTTTPFPHWQEVKSSGWIPFQADYPWTLSSQSGTHFVGVWVADAARNTSRLTRAAMDFASLLLPATQVGQGSMVPYLVYYPAGVDVTATLNITSGAAVLLVWHPGNMFIPDEASPTPITNPQTITFTTKTAGVYLFLVAASQASVYDLSITPGGGPRLPLPTPGSPITATTGSAAGNLSSPLDAGVTYNPILPQSGLDPLSVAQDPVSPYYFTYVPSVDR